MSVLLVSKAELDGMSGKERKALERDGYVLQVVDALAETGANGVVEPLTPRERKLLRAVVDGSSVSAAGDAIGVKRVRAFEIWNAIKAKLGVGNVQEVRTLAVSQNVLDARKIAAE